MNADLVLIRHGESHANADGWLAGTRDVGLTDRGQSQVRALASQIAGLAPDRVVTSDLLRARETAKILGLDAAEVRPAWRETDLGVWTGLRVGELDPAQVDEWRAGRWTPPGAESAAQVADRATADLPQIVRPGATTVVVTHGGVIRAVCRALLGIDGLVPVAPASLTWLRVGDGAPRLQHYNASSAPGLISTVD